MGSAAALAGGSLEALGDGIRYVTREEFAAFLLQLCAPSAHRVTGQVIALG